MFESVLFDQFLLAWHYIAIIITTISGVLALVASFSSIWSNPFDPLEEYHSRTAQVLTPILCFVFANLSLLSLLSLLNEVQHA